MAVTDTVRRDVWETLIERFDAARKRARQYPAQHRLAIQAAQAWRLAFEEALGDRSLISLSVLDDELYIDGQLLPGATLNRSALIQDLVERRMVQMNFYRGLTVHELLAFFPLTCMAVGDIDSRGGWKQLLERQNIQHIQVYPVIRRHESQNSAEEFLPGERLKTAADLYRRAIDAVLQAYADARAGKPLDLDTVTDVVETLVLTVTASPNTARLVTELKHRDDYTISHSVNVCILSLLMGFKLRLPEPVLLRLGCATLLHDIGKAMVPDEILDKPDQLSQQEWDIMQSHALLGAKILAEQERVDPLAIAVAAEHHAREDFSGYPQFHAHRRLHAVSKMTAIADTYDALTSNRSYRRAMLPDQAMRILIDGRGTQFDTGFLKVFLRVSGMYPVGTILELDNGSLAVVEASSEDDVFRPTVKVVQVDGRLPDTYRLLDLSARTATGSFPASVVRAVDPDTALVNVAELF